MNTSKEVKVISLKNRVLKFIPSLAAASVILFMGLHFLNNQNSTVTLDDISSTDVENWYESVVGYSNNTALALAYEMVDFEENELSIVNINNEVIEDYFNSIDNASLLNEIQ